MLRARLRACADHAFFLYHHPRVYLYPGTMSQSPKVPQQDTRYPEFKFRTKPVKERSIWESYAGNAQPVISVRCQTEDGRPALPARTRLHVSLGITAFAAIGLYASDKLEDIFPPAPSGAAPKTSSQPSSSLPS